MRNGDKGVKMYIAKSENRLHQYFIPGKEPDMKAQEKEIKAEATKALGECLVECGVEGVSESVQITDATGRVTPATVQRFIVSTLSHHPNEEGAEKIRNVLTSLYRERQKNMDSRKECVYAFRESPWTSVRLVFEKAS